MGASGGASRGDTRTGPPGRPRGHIERLKSGSLRVKVYAGQDRLLRKDLYLKKTVPAGPDAQGRAEKLRDELIHSIETGNHPKTDGNVDQLMTAYLEETKNSAARRWMGTGDVANPRAGPPTGLSRSGR